MVEDDRLADSADGVQTDPELVSVVVEDEDAPDRCTIYHPESSGVDRMSRWITTETDLLVDLDSVR
ncbi:DUF7511 domain-containing protein (plasmid) [Halorientalis pallida]|uniref:DUF7511 domain-containing protein n=1 Tax=Halorientalis pallida TaxID=2479928 RepID=UPI003C704C2D